MHITSKIRAILVCGTISAIAVCLMWSFKPPSRIGRRGDLNAISALQLIYRLPASTKQEADGIKTVYLVDTICITYYGDFILYRLPSAKDWTTNTGINGTESYFIRRKSDTYGYFLKSGKGKSVQYPADSFLRKNAMSTLGFNQPDSKTWLLAKSVRDMRKDEYMEVYAARQQNQGMKPDSFYFFFGDWLKRYAYSLSPELDSAKGSKLYKARMVFNKRPDSPPRDFSWELKEGPDADKKEAKALIDRLGSQLY